MRHTEGIHRYWHHPADLTDEELCELAELLQHIVPERTLSTHRQDPTGRNRRHVYAVVVRSTCIGLVEELCNGHWQITPLDRDNNAVSVGPATNKEAGALAIFNWWRRQPTTLRALNAERGYSR